MNPLRIGVIGCGTIAQIMHLPHLRELAGRFEIAALCDLSPRVLRDLGEYYGVNRRFTDYRALAAADDIDAVIVLTSGSHAPAALAALHAGKHVIVEKPMCFTLREADEMIAAAKGVNRTLMVAYMKRYDPGYLYAQSVLPEFGDLRYIQINTLHPIEPPYQNIHRIVRADDAPRNVIESLRAEQEQLVDEAVGPVREPLRFVYYDVLLGSVVHDVNALRGLVGEPERVLFSDWWMSDQRYPCVTTMLRYNDQLRASVTWVWLPDYIHYFEEIALMSGKGRLRIQFPSPYLRNFPTPVVVERMEQGAATEKRVTVSYEEAFKQELIHFHECVTHGRPPRTGGQEGKRDIEVLQQIFAHLRPEGLGGEAASTESKRING